MTDRFDELALRVFGEMENPNNLRIVETLSAALRAQHKAGQEAAAKWHEAQAAASDSQMIAMRHNSYAAIIRALPIEDTP